jgi:hypothetical protein
VDGEITAEQFVDNNSDHITLRHMDISTGDAGPSSRRGLSLYAMDFFTLEYSYVHDIGCDLISMNEMNHFTVQYSKLARNHQSAACHGDLIEYQIGDAANFIIRYNFFEDIVGSYAFGSHGPVINDYEIYGNVFYWKTTGAFGNGLVGCLTAGGVISRLKFYNNTLSGEFGGQMGFGILRGSDNSAHNNVWHRTGGSSYSLGFGNAVHSHNTFYNTSEMTGEENLTGDPFEGSGSGNFALTRTTSIGMLMSSPYNIDIFGRARGADGVWDRGAFEYSAADGDNVGPASPKGLKVR